MSSTACSVWGTNVVRISGSTTVLPLVQEGADRFMDLYGEKTVLVQGGGSSVGIAQVKEGIVDIANSSRDLKPEEDDGMMVDFPIALDVIVIVVHPGVAVDDLSAGAGQGHLHRRDHQLEGGGRCGRAHPRGGQGPGVGHAGDVRQGGPG